jgi:L-threonylcarbamoyladenylate synthase
MAEVIPVHWDDPEPEKIAYAADALRRGELIAVPTDTLYCLIADPFNLAAVMKVYEAKSRAWDRSLPMFVESVDQVADLAQHLPSRFYLLAHRYWPGPLSLIVNASGSVPLKVTGNTGRLSVRKPAAKVPLRLLGAYGMPLIATSANLSGFPTCKDATDVLAALGMHVSLILDSSIADSRIATTVDLTVPRWRLIRQGAVSEEEIREFLGD